MSLPTITQLIPCLFATACAVPTAHAVSVDISPAQYVLTRRLAFFPKKNVAVMALVVPRDGKFKPQPWQELLFPPPEPFILRSSHPWYLFAPDPEIPSLCLYGVRGDRLALYFSASVASFAAQERGLDASDLFMVCP